MRTRALGLLTLAHLAAASLAQAQTITVTTSVDTTDVPTSAMIADLPGPDGVVSFREALRVSDNEPGQQTIGFAIPQSDWSPWSLPGQVLVQASFLFSAQQPVTIDGTTQTAFTGDTFPDGWEITFALQLTLGGDGSEIFGVHGSDVTINGDGCHVHDITGPLDLDVYGDGNLVDDNEADTIAIAYGSDNVVLRNTTRRVRVSGSAGTGLPAENNRIGGPLLSDRNYITGWGNYGEHGVPGGTTVELRGTTGTTVENNWIGTTPDGMSIGNAASTAGIGVLDRNDDVTIKDNLIASRAVGVGASSGAEYGIAIWVYGRGIGLDIIGNTLGLDAAGEPLLGGVDGIHLDTLTFHGMKEARIGGPNPGEGNVIAGHSSTGVLIKKAPGVSLQEVTLSGNSIYANGDIGIDLAPNNWTFGVTPNDPLDADTGANHLQNFPELTSATTTGTALQVVGTLHSEPSSLYVIELFASPACHAVGFGEGEHYLGSTTVTTDAAGNATFGELVAVSVSAGWVVTATATYSAGATSEFSSCVTVEAGSVNGNYCTAAANSWSSSGATISSTGSASLAANDLALTAIGVPPMQPGLFFYGQDQQQTPFGNGFLCVGGQLFRLGPPTTSDQFGAVHRPVDYSAPPMNGGAGQVTAGSQWNFQYWYRDPMGAGAAYNLSDGLAVTFQP